VPIFRWTRHVELSWKKSQRDTGAWKTQYKGKFMRIIFFCKNHVFLNQNGEHIADYLIHLNKNKTKWKSKTTQNWSKFNGISTIYVLQFVKSFTIYYVCMYVLEYGSTRYMFTNLDENQWKKFQLKNLNNKLFFYCPNWEKKRILGHKY
jgi:hypothetical protein